MYTTAVLLNQTDHFWQHCAVEQELDVLGHIALNSVLFNDRQECGLVLQEVSPEGDHPLPCWSKVLTLSQDMGESTRGGGKPAIWERAITRGVS